MTFGKKLQSLRKKSGMSQEDIAERLGVARQTVSKWELDQSTPELQYIAEVAKLYNVSTDYLIMDKDASSETNQTKPSKSNPIDNPKETRKKISYRIALSAILCSLGVIGVLAFIALSYLYPWSYGKYERFLGYLFGSKNVVWFVLCIILILLGIALLAVPLLKQCIVKDSKNENTNNAQDENIKNYR